MTVNSIPKAKAAQVFLTNRTTTVYKPLSTLAVQQMPSKDIVWRRLQHLLTMEESAAIMEVSSVLSNSSSERDSSSGRTRNASGSSGVRSSDKSGCSQCDFTFFKDPQDDAMRARFICVTNNEAVLKAVFKINDDDPTFARAIQVALETEDAAEVAKETVYGSKGEAVLKLQSKGNQTAKSTARKQQPARRSTFARGTCPRCGKTDHYAKDCRFKETETQCHFCQKKGHIEPVCLQKKKTKRKVEHILAKPLRGITHLNSRVPSVSD